jgi:hypothetical protein
MQRMASLWVLPSLALCQPRRPLPRDPRKSDAKTRSVPHAKSSAATISSSRAAEVTEKPSESLT